MEGWAMVFFRSAKNDSYHQMHFYFNWDANNTQISKFILQPNTKQSSQVRVIKKPNRKFSPHV
jgi:hypothetical protein